MVRILLTEGSSLSARQTITALGQLHYQIDVLDSHPLFCICRHSRFVNKCIRVPSFRLDPWSYYEALKKQLQRAHYDVLFPTHDQVFLLSRCQDELKQWTNLAVPSFEAIQQVQSKARFVATLNSLDLPHPATRQIESIAELNDEDHYPYFIKLPFSTAGQGVWKIEHEMDRTRVIEHLQQKGAATSLFPVSVQETAGGTLSVAQAIFCHGRLIALHCYQARELGVGGSAVARISVVHPQVKGDVQKLGSHLNWHGAIMLDYLYDEQYGPRYIDCNPRIGETYNATLSGTKLCDQLVQISLNQDCFSQPDSRTGMLTHSVMMRMLAEMIKQPSRSRLMNEIRAAWRKEGIYKDSTDEITLPLLDGRSLIPAVYIAAQLLLSPGKAHDLTSGTVQNYALDAETVKIIEKGAG